MADKKSAEKRLGWTVMMLQVARQQRKHGLIHCVLQFCRLSQVQGL